jgi:hypothetical protein
MGWDERYTLLIHRVGFLSFAWLVTDSLPMMDSIMLTALVDQWHPETYTLHLPCGETTVMLQDITMILGLPIDGTPVCGPEPPAGWMDNIGAAIDIRPPNVGPDDKDKKSSGIHSGWVTAHFQTCPENANDCVFQRYAQAWLWYIVVGFLFSYRSGNTMSWMVLPIR